MWQGIFGISIEIVSVKTGPELRFNSPTNQQQIEQCDKYGFDYPAPTKYAFSKHKNFATSGRPIKVQSILGDGNCGFRSLSYCLFGSESLHKFVRIRIAEYLAEHQDDEWLNLFLDEPIEEHIKKIRTPAKNASETQKYCSNVDFAAASKTFGFNGLLFSDLGCSIYSPALNESLAVAQDLSLSSLPIVFTGGNHFEAVLNVSSNRLLRYLKQNGSKLSVQQFLLDESKTKVAEIQAKIDEVKSCLKDNCLLVYFIISLVGNAGLIIAIIAVICCLKAMCPCCPC
uniref:OTU domain-containing protein n=1 Tax=Ditylenchus dipsaci TaxID=166011 RepID=A0A915E8W0_9BILA